MGLYQTQTKLLIPPANFLIASNAAAAAAANTATLTATGGLTAYVLGFSITTPAIATAVTGVATLGNLTSANNFSMNFDVEETVAGGLILFVSFSEALASGVNGTPFIFLPAITGGASSHCNIWGFMA